jgi:hypothetical protein
MLPSVCNASEVYALNTEFSGGQAPAGPAPWVTVTFANNGANNVRMTVQDAFSDTSGIKELYFDIIPTVTNPSSLGWGVGNYNAGLSTPGTAPISFQSALTNPTGDTTFKADGDGFFSFRIDWTPGQSPMNTNHVAVFDFSATGLNETWFNQLSAPGGGNGSYHVAAHVQNTQGAGSGGSGWIGDAGVTSVPLPHAAAMGLAGLTGLALVRRRKSR